MSFFNFLKFFILVFFSFPFFAFSQQYSLQEVYPGLAQQGVYAPNIFCTNGQDFGCTTNLSIIGQGPVSCTAGDTDKIFKFLCKSISNQNSNCDLSNPYDWGWQNVNFIFNPCKKNECDLEPDHYGSPSFLKANEKYFLFFTHPTGDFGNEVISPLPGVLDFRYSEDGNSWSNDIHLIRIADENINGCGCRGGITRSIAVFKDGCFYIYFEVWRGSDKYECCPSGIGNQDQFIVRVLGSYTAPYVRLEDGKAEVYKKSTGQWIPMDYDEGHNQFPSIDNMQLDIGYIFGWSQNYHSNCPYPNGYTYPNGKKNFI